MEEFKIFRYYSNSYKVYRNGAVINASTGKILLGAITEYGYRRYCFRCRPYNKCTRIFAHRLMASLFLDNPNNLPCVNHKDFNKLNNNIDNLEWCTSEYNTNYSKLAGKYSNNGGTNAKITKEEANIIRDLRENTNLKISELASMFGLKKSAIGNIIYNKSWM